jgi:MOSC domain-containing protein YiiM
MGRDEFVTEFLERGLYGFYLAVTREGHVEAGDPIVALTRDPHRFGVNEVARLYARDRNNVEHATRSRTRRPPGELARLLPQARQLACGMTLSRSADGPATGPNGGA